MNSARLGGSTQVPSPVVRVSTPARAQAIWCTSWVCHPNAVPPGISEVMIPTCPFRDIDCQPSAYRTARRLPTVAGMNRMHRKICRSEGWARAVEDQLLPWALSGADLGPNVLEIGPGFGVTTAVLARLTDRLTALEVDESSVAYLNNRFGDEVNVMHGDGAAMPLPDKQF